MNDKENLRNLIVDVYHLNKVLEKSDVDLDYIAKSTGALIHTNHTHDFSLGYVDKTTLEKVDLDLETIHTLGNRYIQMIVEPESMKQVTEILVNYLANGDKAKPLALFQKFRHTLDGEYNLHLTVCTYNERLNTYFGLDFKVNELGNLSHKMARVHEEDAFSRKYFTQFNTLTERERSILALIAQGYTDHEISEQLGCARHTARTHRKNIRTKLGVHTTAEMVRFALAFDLI
jgi:DNA-binding CsgD family transcriptional regulator